MFKNTFDYKFNNADEWQKQRYSRLIQNFNNAELTDEEKRYLLWLSGYDADTEKVMDNIFKKIRNR